MNAEQADLELGAGQPCGRECVEPLAQGRAGDRQRIDRIRFAALTHPAASVGHQPRREPDHGLAVVKQKPFKATSDVADILDHPDTLGIQRAAPFQQLPEAVAPRGDRPLRQLAAERVGRDRGMSLLVRINSDRHHQPEAVKDNPLRARRTQRRHSFTLKTPVVSASRAGSSPTSASTRPATRAAVDATLFRRRRSGSLGCRGVRAFASVSLVMADGGADWRPVGWLVCGLGVDWRLGVVGDDVSNFGRAGDE